MNIVTEKQCSKCKEWKDKSEFAKNRSKKDGYATECKVCAYQHKKKWADENPQKVREYDHKWDIENPEKLKTQRQRWYTKLMAIRGEKEKERLRQYRYSHPEKATERTRKWRQANPDKAMAQDQNRRARENNAHGVITGDEWLALKEFYNFTCLRCGRHEPEIRLTLDHVLPLSMG